jgi:hypothetical protein
VLIVAGMALDLLFAIRGLVRTTVNNQILDKSGFRIADFSLNRNPKTGPFQTIQKPEIDTMST